jgi:hypothetical protein
MIIINGIEYYLIEVIFDVGFLCFLGYYLYINRKNLKG